MVAVAKWRARTQLVGGKLHRFRVLVGEYFLLQFSVVAGNLTKIRQIGDKVPRNV